jgi:hypothetical protein
MAEMGAVRDELKRAIGLRSTILLNEREIVGVGVFVNVAPEAMP